MKRPSPAVVISLVALFFSLGGASMAASRYLLTSVNQISPKVRHALRGARGPRGPRGAAGPALSSYYTESVPAIVGANATVTTQASCPTGLATGGGYDAPSGLVVTENQPLTVGALPGAYGWLIQAENTTQMPVQMTAWVVCTSG